MMEKEFFWKNFKLNSELHITGSFIYNGLKIFNEMQVFNEEDVFTFLYNISVGVERLEKILIIISNKNLEEKELLKKIKTHNHSKLLSIIEEKYSFKFTLEHLDFLELLSDFYNKNRYNKLSSEGSCHKSTGDLLKYINFIGLRVETQLIFNNKLNSDHIRKIIGKIIGRIVKGLYDKINKESYNKNFNTTETYSLTKASKIFQEESYNFLRERNLMKEIMIFLINNDNKKSKFFNFIKENIKPLKFDPAFIEEYIKNPDSIIEKQPLMEEMDFLYEEDISKKERKKRLEMLSALEQINFPSEEEDL